MKTRIAKKPRLNLEPAPEMNSERMTPDLVNVIGSHFNNNDFNNFRLTCRFFAEHSLSDVKRRIKDRYTIKSISAGYSYMFFLKEDGSVWACGGHYGTKPNQILNLKGVSQIVCGNFHTVFLKEDGSVWACSEIDSKQLSDVSYHHELFQIPNLNDVYQVTAGGFHTIFLKKNGSVWIIGGLNRFGELGLGGYKNRKEPIQIPNLNDVSQVVAGNSHTVFLKKDGSVWVCGINTYGQLGLGDTNERTEPTQIPNLNDVYHVAAGGDHTIFLKKDGSVWACGMNTNNQLGLGDTHARTEPTQIPNLNNVYQVVAGGSHTIFLKKDGSVWACGMNNGQLGLGDTHDRTEPTQIPNLNDVYQVVAGSNHTIFLKKDKSALVCGLYERKTWGKYLIHMLPTEINMKKCEEAVQEFEKFLVECSKNKVNDEQKNVFITSQRRYP